MENKDWKKGLRNYAPEVDNKNAWEKIEPNLPNGNSNNNVKSLVLIALLLVTAASLFFYFNQEESNSASQSLNSADIHSSVGDSNKFSKNSDLAGTSTSRNKRNVVEKDQSRIASSNSKKTGIEETTSKDLLKAYALEQDSTKFQDSMVNSSNSHQKINSSERSRAISGTSNTETYNQLKRLNPMGIVPYKFYYNINDPEKMKLENGQPVKKDQPKNKEWELYLNSQMFSAYHKINPNLLDEKIITYIDNPAFSWDRLGYKLSFGINKNFSEKFKVYSGLSYLYQSQTIKYGYTTVQNSSLTVASIESGSIQVVPEKSTTEEAIQVKNQSFGLHLGFAYALVRRSQYVQELDLHFDWQKQMGDRKFYGSNQYYINLAFNNLYRINSRFSFKLAPVVSYTIREYAGQSSDSFSLKPYSLGIDFGITIHFGR